MSLRSPIGTRSQTSAHFSGDLSVTRILLSVFAITLLPPSPPCSPRTSLHPAPDAVLDRQQFKQIPGSPRRSGRKLVHFVDDFLDQAVLDRVHLPFVFGHAFFEHRGK